MQPKKIKTPRDSAIQSHYMVMPQHVTEYGSVFGGIIMSWIDMAAAMAAQKHCECDVVTASTDQICFVTPIKIGDHVVLQASVNYVGRTSMEVGVRVIREDPHTGESVHATTAFLTFVALDKDNRPTPVPPIQPETPDEIRRYENAKVRVAARRELRERLRNQMNRPG